MIGTALAVCLGYWLLTSTLVFFGAYLLNMALSFLQVLSLMVSLPVNRTCCPLAGVSCPLMQGYALAGHCLVLLLATILDHMGSSGPFYLLWIVFGGLTSLKMVMLSTHSHAHPCHPPMALFPCRWGSLCGGRGAPSKALHCRRRWPQPTWATCSTSALPTTRFMRHWLKRCKHTHTHESPQVHCTKV